MEQCCGLGDNILSNLGVQGSSFLWLADSRAPVRATSESLITLVMCFL